MAGGIIERDPVKLAETCERFQDGTKRLFDKHGGPMYGDMWLFELYHHLADCRAALNNAHGKE
jgi:hypothetical protein